MEMENRSRSDDDYDDCVQVHRWNPYVALSIGARGVPSEIVYITTRQACDLAVTLFNAVQDIIKYPEFSESQFATKIIKLKQEDDDA